MFWLILSLAMAQQPAARVGDQTDHGGVIVSGEPTVFIGGQLAARTSDMVTCPQVLGGVPHVGGPISGGSSTVLINGLPAARQNDLVIETGPPSVITGGEATVLIGG